MINVVVSEFRKLSTTRTAWVLLAGLIVLITAAISEPLLNAPVEAFQGPITEQEPLVITSALVITAFTLLIGLRSFTDEFRYGSIVSTLLSSPVRKRVVLAKVLTAGAAGSAYAIGASLAALGISVAYFLGNDIEVVISPAGVLEWILRFGIFGMLWAAIGVGVGLAVKHQLPAVAGTLMWVLVGENFLGSISGELSRYLPTWNGIAILADGQGSGLGPISATAMLAAWTAVAVIGGMAMMRRRDIS